MSKDVYACFIDYEKAFDRANHKRIISCLKDIGLNGKDIRLIVNLYWSQKAQIQLEQDISGDIMRKRGVRQGCVLSPCLFNLYTEMIFRQIEDMEGVVMGDTRIHNLHYAADTVLLAESKKKVHRPYLMKRTNLVKCSI